jgi:Anti-sigma-K factor rskA
MSEDRDFEGVERLLRSVPAPAELPAGLETMARDAALAPRAPRAAVRPARLRQRFRLNRLVPAAAVLVGAAAASLVIGVGGRGAGIRVERTVTMAAVVPGGAATGELRLGQPDGAMRPIVLEVHGLKPQPAGRYYQMWFADRGEKVALIAFNTSSGGDVTVHGEIPASVGWTRCWVTIESEDHATTRPVLRSTAL